MVIYYFQKLRQHGLAIFRYSDTSKARIALNLVRLFMHEALRNRYVQAPVNNYRMMLDLHTPGLS